MNAELGLKGFVCDSAEESWALKVQECSAGTEQVNKNHVTSIRHT